MRTSAQVGSYLKVTAVPLRRTRERTALLVTPCFHFVNYIYSTVVKKKKKEKDEVILLRLIFFFFLLINLTLPLYINSKEMVKV